MPSNYGVRASLQLRTFVLVRPFGPKIHPKGRFDYRKLLNPKAHKTAFFQQAPPKFCLGGHSQVVTALSFGAKARVGHKRKWL